MSRFVVDVSVALKWYAPEIYRLDAQRLRDHDHDLIAPDLFLLELANTFIKKVRRGEFPGDRVMPAMASASHIVRVLPTRDRIARSVELATTFGRTVYDAAYVAVALDQRCPLVTADRRLYDAIAPSLPQTMLWVEDVP